MKIRLLLTCLAATLLLNGCIVVDGHHRDRHPRPDYDDNRSYGDRDHHRGRDYR